jgi:general secretion pathway protein D
MRTPRQVLLAAVLLLGAAAASAQGSAPAGAAHPGTVPLSSLIATVAQKTGRKFVLDPRVRASVTLIGENPSSVTYDQLLTILDTYGFAAVQTGRSASEYVTSVLRVRSIPAGWLVPILRPLVPRSGHLVAMPCSNSLLIVDRFANVRRLAAIVAALDTGAPIKPPSCIVPMPHPWYSRGSRPASP